MAKKDKVDNEILRAYLWQKIIRDGFSPKSSKEKKRWLELYNKSLYRFWETQDYDGLPKQDYNSLYLKINNVFLKVRLEICIESDKKYSITFLFNELPIVSFHNDENYFHPPIQKLLTEKGPEKNAINFFQNSDIEAVLDGLIFHPTNHKHIKYPLYADSEIQKEIRIGCVNNPFVFLFQMRYQFCLIPENRKTEKERIIDKFYSNIKNKKAVTPNELFDF